MHRDPAQYDPDAQDMGAPTPRTYLHDSWCQATPADRLHFLWGLFTLGARLVLYALMAGLVLIGLILGLILCHFRQEPAPSRAIPALQQQLGNLEQRVKGLEQR